MCLLGSFINPSILRTLQVHAFGNIALIPVSLHQPPVLKPTPRCPLFATLLPYLPSCISQFTKFFFISANPTSSNCCILVQILRQRTHSPHALSLASPSLFCPAVCLLVLSSPWPGLPRHPLALLPFCLQVVMLLPILQCNDAIL